MAAINVAASDSDAPNLRMSGGLIGILIPKTRARASQFAGEILFAATETDPFPPSIEPAITNR
ncbi:hypothetical protein ACFSQT_21635 [Mesorhizobium calcicola]|uniref:Uncharacterized protein n=1 Tax=Mesorhizobium calcicola TaxID=1300310 RepID=A0ABW4WGB0_9HYPH